MEAAAQAIGNLERSWCLAWTSGINGLAHSVTILTNCFLLSMIDCCLFRAIRQKKEDEIRAKMEVKAQAQAFGQALATIGKFIIKKKVGDKDQIFGSVSVKEVAEAIYQQTGRNIPEVGGLG